MIQNYYIKIIIFILLILLANCNIPPLSIDIVEESLNAPSDLRIENHDGSIQAYFYALNYEEFFRGYKLFRSTISNPSLSESIHIATTNLTRESANPNTIYILKASSNNAMKYFFSVCAFDNDGSYSDFSLSRLGCARPETNIDIFNSNFGTNIDGFNINTTNGRVSIVDYPVAEIHFSLTNSPSGIYPVLYANTGLLMDMGYDSNWYRRNRAPISGYLNAGQPVALAEKHVYSLKLNNKYIKIYANDFSLSSLSSTSDRLKINFYIAVQTLTNCIYY